VLMHMHAHRIILVLSSKTTSDLWRAVGEVKSKPFSAMYA